MSGVNKVIILGNLGNDPESRVTNTGDTVCSFSVATSEKWKDKTTGQQQERTEWHNITAFGGLGGVCSEYLKKGSKVYIEGSIRTTKYKDKNTGEDKYSTGIIAREMQMLDSRSGGQQSQNQPQQQAQNQYDSFNDVVPF